MLAAWKANASATRYDIACSWVQSNPQRWRSWIPDPTVCSRGYGLYDEGDETFTATRESATTCRACPPGMYSVPFNDDSGATFLRLQMQRGWVHPCRKRVRMVRMLGADVFCISASLLTHVPCHAERVQDQFGKQMHTP